jgi:hypothetical protein
VASGSPEIAHFVEGEWWLTGVDGPVVDEIAVLIEQPLVPPALLDQGEDE